LVASSLAEYAAKDYEGKRPNNGSQNEKRHWSELFANACAVMIARTLREHQVLRSKRILPRDLDSGTEPLTPLGSGEKKRIDVTVADAVLGLEIGVSLKGLNFKDGSSGNYDKNLTGRLYELSDEVRMVHTHLPHAFMVAVFFLPLAATADKASGISSFAHTMSKLRQRTGRLDPTLPGHANRCDAAFVALYTNGDEGPPYEPGVVRFLDVGTALPRRGRPTIDTTLSLDEMVDAIVEKATFSTADEWIAPEEEP